MKEKQTAGITQQEAQNTESTDTRHPEVVSAYQIYLERRRQKETAIFTRLATLLSILFVIALFLASGLVSVPFLNNFSEKTHYAKLGDIPCPTATTAITPNQITVTILNGTEIPKLASKTSAIFKTLGFKIKQTGNADRNDYDTPGLILVSQKHIDQAYTVALAIPNSTINLADVKNVTVILGRGAAVTVKPGEFKELIKRALVAPKNCLPTQ